MAKLIALADIPTAAARRIEAAKRNQYPSRKDALDAATYQIEAAPGCYGGAFAPVLGWVLTAAAAEAIAAQQTKMPGGTSHRRRAYVHRPEMGA